MVTCTVQRQKFSSAVILFEEHCGFVCIFSQIIFMHSFVWTGHKRPDLGWSLQLLVSNNQYIILYTGCKVKSWGGLFLSNRWSQTYTSNYKIGLKNVKIYVMAFLNFKNRFCENYKN